jgi:hypothetical protein
VTSYVHGAAIEPGMVITSTSKKVVPPPSYLVLGKRNTPENRVKLKVHILGHPAPLTFEVTIKPMTEYILSTYMIEELPG